MRISEEKTSHLAHIVFDALTKNGAVRLLVDDAKVRRELKQAVARWLKAEEEIEETVRKKIVSYSRKITEGSPEWDVLFQKHYLEELNKRGKT